MKIKVDSTVRVSQNFAQYSLVDDVRPTAMLSWRHLAPDGTVVVRLHPSVLESDEKIVGVLQHEIWELSQLRARVEAKGSLDAESIARLVEPTSATNLHGQAWDVADLRLLVMRASDDTKKAELERRLMALIGRYQRENVR